MGGHKNKPKKNQKRRDASRNRNNSTTGRPAKKEEDPEAVVEVVGEIVPPRAESAMSVEDQANVEKVFSTLAVTPPRTFEEKPVEEEKNEEKQEEEEENELNTTVIDTFLQAVGEDQVDGPRFEEKMKIVKETEKFQDDNVSEVSEERAAPGIVSNFKFEGRDQEIQVNRFLFNMRYGSIFAGLLNLIDPECRWVAGVGPAESFDAEGVANLVKKMTEAGGENVWPFEKKLDLEPEEQHKLFTQLSVDIQNMIKFCLMLACLQSGYELNLVSKKEKIVSNIWGKHLDPLVELKTVLAVCAELEEGLKAIGVAPQGETRFWSTLKNYSEVIVPALESYDSKTLVENGITDCTATIHGLKELGFEISEQDVDEMLEIMAENEFCDFVPTALHHVDVFTTTKQLKLIHAQLEKMSKVVDIRVKQSGIQAITHIFSVLNPEAAMEVLDEMKESPKLSLKIFGIELDKFDSLLKASEPKRTNYFKLFTVALNKSEGLTVAQCSAALMCAYLCCSPFDVNQMIFKILGTRPKATMFKEDKEMLVKVLLSLPFQLREQLEIGDEFSMGEVTENRDSMYFQVKSALRGRIDVDFVDRIDCFLTTPPGKNRVISIDRVMRMFIKCVEDGESQKMSVQCLNLLRRDGYHRYRLPKELFEDLLILALSKYSIPDAKSLEAKYKFLEDVFYIVEQFQKNGNLQIDNEKTRERWSKMEHLWFSVLYLSARFPILKPIAPKVNYPWVSSEIWDDEKKEASEEDAKKYGRLAHVSTAWPECTSIEIVERIIREHVPPEVDRVVLYEEMLKYVMNLNSIDDFTKKRLGGKYESAIRNFKKEKDRIEEEDNLLEEDEEWFKTEYAEEVWSTLPEQCQQAIHARRALQTVEPKLE